MDTSSLDSSNDFLIEDETNLEVNTCNICKNEYMCPRVLNCLHVFCEKCILQLVNVNSMFSVLNIICPTCSQPTTTQLNRGTLTLPQDYVTRDILEVERLKTHRLVCKSCRDNKEATHKCITCCNFLCSSCESMHKMLVTPGQYHYMVSIDEMIQSAQDKTALHKMVLCEKHNNEQMVYYCNTCNELACTKCLNIPSPRTCQHSYDSLSNAYKKYGTELEYLVRESKNVMKNVSTLPATLEKALDNLQTSHDHVKSNVEETFHSFKAILETCKNEVLVQLKSAQKQQELKIMDKFEEVKKITDNISGVQQFATRLLENGSESEIMALKKLIFTQMLQLFGQIPDVDIDAKLLYSSDISGFENHCRKYFGQIETEQGMNVAVAPISPPTPRTNFLTDRVFPPPMLSPMVESQIFDLNLARLCSLNVDDNPILSTMSSPDSLGDLLNTTTSLDGSFALNNLQALAKLDNLNINNNNNNMLQSLMSPLALNQSGLDPFSVGSVSSLSSPTTTLSPDIYGVATNSSWYSKERRAPPTRPKRHSSRPSMDIVAKFGQMGSGLGQFHSPHGFCLSPTEDIVVADTHNHRIQVFEKDGTYKTEFGREGKEDGYLFYPRKVVFLNHNQIVVCDRGSDRSRVQIFEYPTGKFIKKIQVQFIEIVAGVAVTANGHLALVDSVHPTVFVLNVNEDNGIMKWFDCASYMEEPSDIIVRDDDYYVCDFKGHSIVVFNDEGVCLRRIGGEYITSFPNGIDISENGEILVGDSHGNRFHVAVFSHDGTHLTDLECPYIKVSRCCGLKITSGGHIVTLAKNNHHVLVLNATV
ncbi:unnamed protein product [Macrosiphum euphorbiae]|uniref:Uncharacterized protein n=1 Tax=Macrosiphum euphorbiae TaxID=13131 RepID=A0AAV0VYV6_9HEMI|nr:unnamed protein product [Macrosiphum euphorbiae]